MTLIAEASAAASFHVQLPGTTPLRLPNITRTFQRIDRGNPAACNPAKATLQATAGLPGAFAIDGIPLDTDGRVVELDLTRDPRMSWSLVAPGPVDAYAVTLQELVVADGATASVQRSSALVGGQSFALLDSSLLVPGHSYVVAITSIIGRPGSATGDFQAVSVPVENATMWSHHFEVRAK